MQSDNHFQYAKSGLNNDVMLLDASMNDFSYGMHAHEEFSFGVTLAGRQDFFALGEHHKSHPNNIIIFNPDDAHDGHSGGDDTLHYKMLYIHPDQLTPMLKNAGLPKAHQFRIKQCVHKDPVLRQHILHLAMLVENQNTSALQYSSALFEFSRYLTLQTGTQLESNKSQKDALFERVREYIHSHITEEVSLDELSKLAHMSKYHFLRCFRDYFGMTPHRYCQSYKLSKARQALESGMSISDVVYIFGFSDLSYFNRCFKPVFGMTPYQFQRSLQTP